MFCFWNPPSLLRVANIGVVASSLNTPDSLSSSHYQLSIALQLEVEPGDPLPHPQAFVWVDLVQAMWCSVASMSSCVPLACHSMKTLSQHSHPLLLVLRIFFPPLLSLGRRECDSCPTIVSHSLHFDLLWASLWIAFFAKGGVKGALIYGCKGKLLGSC